MSETPGRPRASTAARRRRSPPAVSRSARRCCPSLKAASRRASSLPISARRHEPAAAAVAERDVDALVQACGRARRRSWARRLSAAELPWQTGAVAALGPGVAGGARRAGRPARRPQGPAPARRPVLAALEVLAGPFGLALELGPRDVGHSEHRCRSALRAADASRATRRPASRACRWRGYTAAPGPRGCSPHLPGAGR